MKPGFETRRWGYALVLGWLFSAAALVAAQEAKPRSEAATRQFAAAAALQNREQYDLAADEWAKFLRTYPQDPRADRALHYLGICQLKNKQYPQALEAFKKIIAEHPKFELLASTYLHLGLTQYNLAVAGQKEFYPEAAKPLAGLIEKYPQGKEVPQALFYEAESLYAQGQKAEAAALYSQVVQKYPQDPLLPDALYALGVTQEELGQAAAAGASYDAYLKQFAKLPLAAEVTLRRGETLLAQGQYEVAEKWFAAAAARQGFALADLALLREADCLSELRKYPEAAALYASLPQKFPDSQYKPKANLAAGKCAYLAGKFAEARDALGKVLAAGGPTAPEAAHWLARCLLKQQQLAEALKIADSALPQAGAGPFAVDLMVDKADALYDLPDRRRESIPLYVAVAQQHPNDTSAPQALYMAAFASLGIGDHQAAITHADAFLKQFADKDLAADVMFVAAEANLQLGKYAEAGQRYEELLRKYPQRADAETWKVRRGLALYLAKKPSEALTALQTILATLKNKAALAEAQYLIGSSQNDLQQYDAAAKSLAASLQADPNWRQADETLLGLAFAERQSNRLNEAKAHLAQLLKQFPNSPVLDRAHYRLAEYAFSGGDLKTAADEYKLTAEKYGSSPLAPHAIFGLGWTQLSQSDYAGAVQTLDGLLGKNPPPDLAPRIRYARALAREQLKQYAPAIEDLQAFLQSQPTGAEKSDARYVLGLCQAGLKQPVEAAATFESLLKEDPKYVGADKALYELAWAYKAQDKQAEATQTFARLAKEYASSSLTGESLYHVAEAQYQLEDFKQAALNYYEAMQKAGKTELGEKAAHKLGWAYFRQNQFDKAQQSFAYQRATFPQGSLAADAAFMEAECLFKQGKFAESLPVYAQVKNPAGKDFAVLALLHSAQAEAKLKQWPKSLALLEQAAKDYANSEYIPEILYEQAWARQNLGQAEQALPLYEEVTAKTDREVAARARFMIGEIYFEQKNHAEAIKNFFKAAYAYSYPEWQANAHYEAGRCFEVLGKKDQAKKSYQEVVDKFASSDKAALAKQRLDALKGE